MTSIVCWQKALAIKDTIVCSRLLSVLPSVSSLYFSPFFSHLSIDDRSRSQRIAICSPVTIAVVPVVSIQLAIELFFLDDTYTKILISFLGMTVDVGFYWQWHRKLPFLFFPNDNIFFLFYVKSTFLILLLPLIICYRSMKSTLPLVIRHIGKFDGFL